MTHWLIKTEMGYLLEDLWGNRIMWFDMAANSKAYCMEKGIDAVYLNRRSDPEDIKSYELFTGKKVWFVD